MLVFAASIGACSSGSGGSAGETPAYTVTASAGAGGSISPSNTLVDRGATAVFQIAPDPGFRIEGVSGCGGQLDDSTYGTGPITAACTVSVHFSAVSVSGLVSPAAGTSVDRDVNDPNAPYTSNDTLETAQLIPNPVTLGGYVNEPEHGPDGRSFADGDRVDVFRVGLLAGQTLTLWIGSNDVADDLDLYLVDMQVQLVDASLDPLARVESLVVPPGGDGEYYVVVHAWTGASNYTLTIGHPIATAQATVRLSDSFVPGQAVVRFAGDAGQREGTLQAQTKLLGWQTGREAERTRRNVLIDLHELRSAAPQSAAMTLTSDAYDDPRGIAGLFELADPRRIEKLETLYLVKGLYGDPDVSIADPNLLHEPRFVPNDPFHQHQWHYPQISLGQAWNFSTGLNTVIAVADTGVLPDHPDLQGQLAQGYDFILNVPGGDDPGAASPPPGGSSFHGTHVAGTIGAATNNGVGVAGLAFEASIMPLRVCDSSSCSAYAIEQAVRYAAGLPNDSGTVPLQPADVINLSLGRGGPPLASEQALYDDVRQAGLVVVAAAGNDNSSVERFPAAYQGVIAVGAVDIRKQRAPYSNFGAWIDVAAPGGNTSEDLNADGYADGILSTYANDADGPLTYHYAFLQGTSMAAPHVTGVVALMKAAAPHLTPADITSLLISGAITDDLGAPGRDDLYGHGLINAHKAVIEAINTAGEPVVLDPLLAASSTALSFGATLDSRVVTLSNVGGGSLTVGEPTETSGGWLSLSLAEEGDNTIVTMTVDRTGLDENVYLATVTFPSTANTVDVSVLMQVADLAASEVGLQYVALIDQETFETKHSTVTEPMEDGSHAFRIEHVENGSYWLWSGSNSDNDPFICDAGESCGTYRSIGEPLPLDVDGEDIDSLQFFSGYHPELFDTESGPLDSVRAR